MSAPSRLAAPAWRALLSGASPREILTRIVPGDPLGVRPRVREVLRKRALLFDADRVLLRALALLAREAMSYRGRPGFERWSTGIVERALDDLLEEDLEAGAVEPVDGAFAALAPPLGLDPGLMLARANAFNQLEPSVRQAFFAWVLDDRPLEEVAREHHQTPTRIARKARRALKVLFDPDASSERTPT